jgi:glycosyltransferase involved in cell wall biosynthesis
MAESLTLSIVVPAYQASETIGTTLASIFASADRLPKHWRLEVLVVDDGSPDGECLQGIVAGFPKARLLKHDTNRGMCAARNTGISASQGTLVTILDADDTFVTDWPERLGHIRAEWPEQAYVCFSACQNVGGQSTVHDPTFSGFLTFDDLLNERHAGEYLPLFRGPYIRSHRYVDLQMRRSCGIVSYLALAREAPFWVTNRVLRIYNDQRHGSVSSDWTDQVKAQEMVRCYRVLLERYGADYAVKAPQTYRTKLLRLALYLKLAGEAEAWSVWTRAAHWRCPKETVGVFLMLLLGRHFTAWAGTCAKRLGAVRRYG